jgi:acyl-CoA thioester hydrolase
LRQSIGLNHPNPNETYNPSENRLSTVCHPHLFFDTGKVRKKISIFAYNFNELGIIPELVMAIKNYHFQLEMKVRDYECDLQGVVNNSNYQRYMEHTRHEYLESLGENFGALHDRGIDAFVARVDIRYKASLRSGNQFLSCLNIKKEGIKLIFEQDIYRISDGALAASGRVETVVVKNGVLTRGEFFDYLLKKAGIHDA